MANLPFSDIFALAISVTQVELPYILLGLMIPLQEVDLLADTREYTRAEFAWSISDEGIAVTLVTNETSRCMSCLDPGR